MDSFVEEYIKSVSNRETLAVEIAHAIQNKKNNILDLIQCLQSSLTDNDVEKRITACSMLSEVVYILASCNVFLPNEISVLVEFLCAKLKDHFSLHPPVLRCLNSLSRSGRLSNASVSTMLQTLFQEVHVQSCLQKDRLNIYEMLTNLFDYYKRDILRMGNDFMYNFVRAIDGEQDPQNLVVIFNLCADLLNEGIDISTLTEELFEVTSCYFPIDFNPDPSAKRYQVTSDELIKSLRRVLSSCNAFAPFCIPLMLEKLDSDIQSAKLDAMRTLGKCIVKYRKNELAPFLSSLWQTLKREILQAISSEVEKCGLELLKQLVKNVSLWAAHDNSDKRPGLRSFLKDILDDCLPIIKQQSRDKMAWTCSQILLACADTSSAAFVQISKSTLPIVLQHATNDLSEMCENPNAVPFLVSSLQTSMNFLLEIMSTCKSFTFENHPVVSYKQEIIKLITSVLTNAVSDQIKCTAAVSLAALIGLDVATTNELDSVGLCLLSLLEQSTCSGMFRYEVLSVCSYISQLHPEMVKRVMLNRLVDVVDDNANAGAENIGVGLESLASLCGDPKILLIVVAKLLEKVQGCKITEENSLIVHEYLHCLKGITEKSSHVELLIKNCTVPLIKLCIAASMEHASFDKCCVSCDMLEGVSRDCLSMPILKSVAEIIRNCSRKLLPGELSDEFTELISSTFLDGNVEHLEIVTPDKLSFVPFSEKASALQTRTVCFITASICVLRSSIIIPRMEEFSNCLLNLSLGSSDQPTYVASSKGFAALINKFPNDSNIFIQKVEEKLDYAMSEAYKSKNENRISSEYKTQLITLLIWTTKSLSMCNHDKTKDFVYRLMYFMDDDDVGSTAAAGFDIIMHDTKEVLSIESHATRKLMYRQRFFLIILPKLLAIFHSAKSSESGDNALKGLTLSEKSRANCLTALSYTLGHLPKQVLLQHLEELMPLLIHSLQSNELLFLKSVLQTLYSLMQDASEFVASYVDTLTDKFLDLCTYEAHMGIRIQALRCVGACTLLPTHVLLPIKCDVIKRIGAAIDDRKRDVRAEAAKARSEWYLVGT